jgi:K+-sensing histidine kinase KdpD
LLVSALRNLFDNALKHGISNTAIHAQITQESSGVGFRVSNETSGLTRQECEQAVQRFWRKSNSAPGSGLGLSIVSMIAQKYGGSFTFAPGAQGGIEATLVFPKHATKA